MLMSMSSLALEFEFLLPYLLALGFIFLSLSGGMGYQQEHSREMDEGHCLFTRLLDSFFPSFPRAYIPSPWIMAVFRDGAAPRSYTDVV
ncbi:hypothetical protein IE53DRAFT_385305 [Violaceomyces palustris]|uniref:Uncharacterized protein n=1 Tax=Violaceomyces palustris TaxID=1673888 RepID=A0ACD0P2I4_9BASI|nr:hypothetical protein IE53DRAFT_385305 [Violaceomyces palustris]